MLLSVITSPSLPKLFPVAQSCPPSRTCRMISSRGRRGGPNITYPMRASNVPLWQGHFRHLLDGSKSTEHPAWEHLRLYPEYSPSLDRTNTAGSFLVG